MIENEKINSESKDPSASWAKAIAEAIRQMNWSGETFIGTRDHRGDGYDIACSTHIDDYDSLVRELLPLKITVSRLHAGGYFVGYILLRASADGLETIRNCQHPGSWGPWYHLSLYRRAAPGAPWKFVRELGKSGHGDNTYLYGRPTRLEDR